MEEEKEITLYQKFLNRVLSRKKRISKGEVNCVPNPHKNFRQAYSGLEQGKMVVVTAPSKCAKSQFTIAYFVMNTLLYWVNHQDKISPIIYYFNLEESDMSIVQKMMCHLLFILSNGDIDVDSEQVDSKTNELSDDVVEYLKDPAFANIAEAILSRVRFIDERNRIGIAKVLKEHAMNNGREIRKDKVTKDSEGNVTGKISIFDRYVSNDSNEYVIGIVDHISCIAPISGETQRESMSELAKSLIEIRNKYNHSIIVVQQQGNEVSNQEAVKMNRIQSQFSSLSDCKDLGKACNIMIGLTNPSFTKSSEFAGYDIKKLGDNFRAIEVIVNRDGSSGQTVPFYFSGRSCYFKELPAPNDPKINEVYNEIEKARKDKRTAKFNFNIVKTRNKQILLPNGFKRGDMVFVSECMIDNN